MGSIGGDKELYNAILSVPTTSIILLEDIDCVSNTIDKDGSIDLSDKNKVTKAGLLNILDGVLTPDGRIFILTTNKPEPLDAVLIRPGRIDIHEKFELFDPKCQIKMAKHFYGDDVKFVPFDCKISPAALQCVFMLFKNDIKNNILPYPNNNCSNANSTLSK